MVEFRCWSHSTFVIFIKLRAYRRPRQVWLPPGKQDHLRKTVKATPRKSPASTTSRNSFAEIPVQASVFYISAVFACPFWAAHICRQEIWVAKCLWVSMEAVTVSFKQIRSKAPHKGAAVRPLIPCLESLNSISGFGKKKKIEFKVFSNHFSRIAQGTSDSSCSRWWMLLVLHTTWISCSHSPIFRLFEVTPGAVSSNWLGFTAGE